jgi:uncharacterized protein DUF4345
MTKGNAFRVLLALVGLAHLALGLTANLAPPETLARVVSDSYGATLEVTPQMQHVLRILGVFMIGIGMMALWACGNPQRHPTVVLGIVAILLLRVLQRVMLAKEIETAFNISPARLWVQAGFFLIIAVALFLLRPRANTAAS